MRRAAAARWCSPLRWRGVARARGDADPAGADALGHRSRGLLSAPTASTGRALDDYARRTGHQVLVYIDHTTGGVPIEDWGVRAFERWRVGRSGIDDGLVLLVFADDHRVRFEVGYGLEAGHARCARQADHREEIVPRIRAGDRDGAIRAGVDALSRRWAAPATRGTGRRPSRNARPTSRSGGS